MRWPAIFAVSALPLFVTPASAGDVLMSSEEWSDLTLGKTVYYEVDGVPSGREYYPPDQAFAVFVRPDGSCVEGPYAHDEARICFWYGEDFQCFFHVRRNDALFSRPDTGGKDHRVSKIASGEPLYCSPG